MAHKEVVYLAVSQRDGEPHSRVFVCRNHGHLVVEDARDPDIIAVAAQAVGFEITYCSSFSMNAPPPWEVERMHDKIFVLIGKPGENRYDIGFDVTHRLVKYST